MALQTCAHCGQQCGDYDGGHGGITTGRQLLPLCHPNDPARPDCYRRVTVYHERLGALISVRPLPAGVTRIGELDLTRLTSAEISGPRA